ncbi:MAG: TRAP transporter substrate-binding protein DctP [Rhodospirillum sp.]|nr:TRAP transporter substrate-binding protein DctP [Rhodospirillum sp.]MCF8491504.1 TRAP transporter substrate-binding protein DctP [Rhodospirillum sp.]
MSLVRALSSASLAASLAAGLAFAVMAPGAGTAQAATVMRCSHQLPPQHHVAKVIDRWAEEVERLSKGEIDVQVFGAESLMKAKENILAVAKGGIECAFSLNFQWGKTLPLMNVTLGPYTMSSLDAWRKWPTSEAAAFLEKKLLEKGVRNVVWVFQTNESVFTSKGKALITPVDFQGMKMRGLNPTFDAGLEALGATPVSMPGGDVYQSLGTGVIDAALTDVAAAYARKYYEVQDYMTDVQMLSVYLHGYVTPKWYDGLSDAAKEALKTAGLEAAAWAVDAAVEAVAESPDKLIAKGVHFHRATDEENAALKAVMQPAFDAAFTEATGAEGRVLLDLIAKLQ